MHPREHRLTRRNLVRGAIGASAAVGVAGVAAGCQNTTTAVGAGEGGAPAAAVRKLVVPRPTGPNGLPLPRPDYSVTWAITADNPPIKDGLKPEGGTLNVYNYADYIWPGLVKRFEKQYNCQVKIATYNSADEATAKLSSGSVGFDVVIGLSANNMVTLIAQQLMLPLTHSYLPNLAKNIWPALQDPFYDREARYTVPYVVWLDGIGWRNDKISNDIAGMKVPWDIFWQSKPWTGKVGILDDQRDALAMPMQRDAMRVGRIPDLNTEDPEIIAKAGRDLSELTTHQQHQGRHHRLPDAAGGQVLAAPGVVGRHARRRCSTTCPRAPRPKVISFWGPDQGGVVQNDMLWVVSKSTKPVLAHAFLNFMLDTKNAYDNFVQFNGYTPPQNTIDARLARQEGPDPEERSRPPFCGPTSSRTTRSCSRSASRARSSGRTPGPSSRPAEWSLAGSGAYSPPPASYGSRSSSWSRCTRCCASRSATRTRSTQPIPFWNPLDWNVGYLLDTLSDFWNRRRVLHGLRAHGGLRLRGHGPLAPDRLPGRLLRGAPRRPLARRWCCCCSCCRSGSTT